MLVDNVVGLAGIRNNCAGGRDRNWRWRREAVSHCRWLSIQQGNGETVALLGILVLPNREVECVCIVREWFVADTKTTSEYRLIGEAVGEPEAWRKIFVISLTPKVERISGDAGDHQNVLRRIVVGVPAGATRSCRQIQFPAQASVNRQSICHVPGILAEKECFCFSPGTRDERDIAADFGRSVDQQCREIVCNGSRRRALGCASRRSRSRTIELGGTCSEINSTTW